MLKIAIFAAAMSGQITKAPEFSDAAKVQSAKPAPLETTSHASAERAEVHEGLLRQLRGLAGYSEGVSLIEKRLNGPAEEWFAGRGMVVGVAVVRLLNGREAESAEMLCDLAGSAAPPVGLIGVMGESIGVSKAHAPKMLEVMKKLARSGDAASEFALGLAYLRQAEPQVEAGLLRLREAAKLDWKDTRALMEVAKQETVLEHREAAVAALEEVLKRDDRVAAAHYRLSQLYRVMGQAERGRVHMNRYRELIGKP
jgi:hypothetical protein